MPSVSRPPNTLPDSIRCQISKNTHRPTAARLRSRKTRKGMRILSDGTEIPARRIFQARTTEARMQKAGRREAEIRQTNAIGGKAARKAAAPNLNPIPFSALSGRPFAFGVPERVFATNIPERSPGRVSPYLNDGHGVWPGWKSQAEGFPYPENDQMEGGIA